MIERGSKHNAKALEVEIEKKMSTKTKIEINTELFNKLIDVTPVEKLKSVKSMIMDMNDMVNLIESRMATTQHHYGDYMQVITNKFTATMFIIAGANRQGVIAALKINTGDF